MEHKREILLVFHFKCSFTVLIAPSYCPIYPYSQKLITTWIAFDIDMFKCKNTNFLTAELPNLKYNC